METLSSCDLIVINWKTTFTTLLITQYYLIVNVINNNWAG